MLGTVPGTQQVLNKHQLLFFVHIGAGDATESRTDQVPAGADGLGGTKVKK